MKASVYVKTGSEKALQIQDLPSPVPRADQVLLRVRAASVNPLDWRLKSHRPGVDVAGTVEAVGENVEHFKVGDAVFGTGKGAFAEHACAFERRLALKPESISFELAASIPVAGLSALQGLRKGHLQSGQKILINGAAGGIGTFAVQIAKASGAHVTGVCSTNNVEMVRSLGADRVFDYTREDFAQDPARYDLILDNAASRPLSDLRRVMAPHAICVIAGAAKTVWPMMKGFAELFARSVLMRQKITFFVAKVTPEDLGALSSLIISGKLAPVIDRVYPLSKAADAIAYVETGHARAKVVINMEEG